MIETENVEFEDAIGHRHMDVKPGKYVMLSVNDTGIGMTPEVQSRIFEPFFTTKEKGKKESVAGKEIPKGAETILVAEDKERVRKLVLRILRKQWYQILEASNGFEALELARGQEGKVDLLMTDVVMSGMSGFDLADQLRPFRKGLKVLFMSGYTDRAFGDQQSLPEGSRYLPKPFSVEKLACQVREILDS